MSSFVADLHIHSHFSRATSHDLDLEHLWIAAQEKGIAVVGTGDFTHPGWFAELEQKLLPRGNGLFCLRPDLARDLAPHVPPSCAAEVQFMLTVEISNIYKHAGSTRKVHNLVCLPDLQSAARFGTRLGELGNVRSDGRPILGLDSRDLLELALDCSPRAVLIPAHIWTPWFSVLGSKSGFDTVDACYRDLAAEVFAVETGLSSDPPMNWRLSSLDRFSLVSNSDAHSPQKLGREANLFSCEPSYDGIFGALRDPAAGTFRGTIEFFPEEGKYHLDGHRKCAVRLTPAESLALGGRCPECGGPLTLGVLYRMEQLADRPLGSRPAGRAPFVSLVGLCEVLADVHSVGPSAKRVQAAARQLEDALGPELFVLQHAPLPAIERVAGPVTAEAIRRVRRGEIHVEGGYDGKYGRVHVLTREERAELSGQHSFFVSPPAEPAAPSKPRRDDRVSVEATAAPHPMTKARTAAPETDPAAIVRARSGARDSAELRVHLLDGLNETQRQAVLHRGGPLVIVAGPGTGKTRVLTHRIAHRIAEGLPPTQVLAVTFTKKAAVELRERLEQLLSPAAAAQVVVFTFHALALSMLSEAARARGNPSPTVLDEAARHAVLSALCGGDARAQRRAWDEVAAALRRDAPTELSARYRARLDAHDAVDLEALVSGAADLLETDGAAREAYQARFRHVSVDEYQDLNPSQYRLVRALCPRGEDLCVIGDPDQAIYSFRGADPSYFLRFETDYPGATCLSLSESYRTAQKLLQAAQQVVANNRTRRDAHTSSTCPGAPRVLVCRALSPAAEAELVVHSIEQALGGVSLFSVDSGRLSGVAARGEVAHAPLSFADVAVLFRTRAQAEPLVHAFEQSGMPYRCPAHEAQKQPLKPVLDLLRRHLTLQAPERIAQQTIDGLTVASAAPLAPRERALLTTTATAGPRDGLAILVDALCTPDQKDVALGQATALACVLGERRAWQTELLELACTIDEEDAVARRAEAVSLLTLHASKGLEFGLVFIVGLEEGLLPLEQRDQPAPPDLALALLEEERRLCYVGMTRAKHALVLTHVASRAVRGQAPDRTPSRFITEIATAWREHSDGTPRRPRPASRQLTLF